MATKMTENGVSTTTAPGTERYEYFTIGNREPRRCVQYDYRHTNGELFSAIGNTLEFCREERDKWLVKNNF